MKKLTLMFVIAVLAVLLSSCNDDIVSGTDYTLTYSLGEHVQWLDADGNALSLTQTVDNTGTAVAVIPEIRPTIGGLTFEHWALASTPTVEFDWSEALNGDITLVPYFPATVSYNVTEGAHAGDNTAEAPADITVAAGFATLDVPADAVHSEGNNFLEWSTSATEQVAADASTVVVANTMLYAFFAAPSTTITLDEGTGITIEGELSLTAGGEGNPTFTAPADPTISSGLTFSHWYVADGEATEAFDWDAAPDGNDITLRPYFPVTVSYNVTGGAHAVDNTTEAPAAITVAAGFAPLDVPADAVHSEGNSFLGWSTSDTEHVAADASTVVVADTVLYAFFSEGETN